MVGTTAAPAAANTAGASAASVEQSAANDVSDVIETDIFGGSTLKLEEYGLGDRTYEINFAAARLARLGRA